DAYRAGTKDLLIDPAHVERIVCIPELEVAGTFDRLATIDGTRYIADLKGLELGTPLPTPTGWTTMQAVQPGDQVLGSDGRPCRVLEKSAVHWRDCYRVRFDDGSSIVCDAEHRWRTHAGPTGDRVAVRTTDQIRRTLRYSGRRGQRQHRIPNARPLNLPDAELPIHPYVLGAWLGDGKHTSGEITKEQALFDEIEACGYPVGSNIASGARTMARTVLGLRTKLRSLGVLAHKHVPDLYLRASAPQRLALLQGLMDTDGTWNRKRHQAVFSNTNKALSEAVHELVVSLGWRATIFSTTCHGFGVTTTDYRVHFTPVGANPFRLPRKADLVDVKSTTKASRRLVIDVEEMPTVATQCITVDSPDNTYLCGREMIPTHNTGRDLSYSWGEIAIQLALYAHAATIYDPASGEHAPMPGVDQHWAVVIHLPVGEARCTLHKVDIAAGWEMAQTCGVVRAWRKRRDLAVPLLPANPEPAVDEPAAVDRQKALKDRLAVLAGIDGAKPWVAQHWPPGVHGNGTWSGEECDLIAEVLSLAEQRFQAPFPDDPPVEAAPEPLIPPPLPKPARSDGAPVDPADIEALKALVAGLDQRGRELAKRWAFEAREAGRGFDQFAEMRTRTLAVATAAMRCAAGLHDVDEPEALTRAALAEVTGQPVHPTWPLGAVLGGLTKTRAERLTALAEAFAAGDDDATRLLGAQIAAQPGGENSSNPTQEK
ncbi:MAG TPA: LAGLIDADG family homing endonuclease, partial [Nocardioidaceae bacterium]|nr:LAGLIDADG family homing endonuclease [Nocardioidaceae bacterium]